MMKRQTIISRGVPVIEKYLCDKSDVFTSHELSNYLEVSQSCMLGLLTIMEALGIVEKRRKGVEFWYLKDKYAEAEINDMVITAYIRRRLSRRI